MFVGEAPGYHEDKQGHLFVGAAGKLRLDRPHAGAGFIANVLKSRPPGNRDPQADEIEACRPYLMRQIALIRPAVTAARQLRHQAALRQPVGHHQSARGAAAARGRGAPLLPVSHLPAALYTLATCRRCGPACRSSSRRLRRRWATEAGRPGRRWGIGRPGVDAAGDAGGPSGCGGRSSGRRAARPEGACREAARPAAAGTSSATAFRAPLRPLRPQKKSSSGCFAAEAQTCSPSSSPLPRRQVVWVGRSGPRARAAGADHLERRAGSPARWCGTFCAHAKSLDRWSALRSPSLKAMRLAAARGPTIPSTSTGLCPGSDVDLFASEGLLSACALHLVEWPEAGAQWASARLPTSRVAARHRPPRVPGGRASRRTPGSRSGLLVGGLNQGPPGSK